MKILLLKQKIGFDGASVILDRFSAELPQICFDWCVSESPNQHLKQTIEQRGGRVLFLPERGNRFLRIFTKALWLIRHTSGYDAVHINSDRRRWWPLCIAWLAGVKKRIIHVHASYPEGKETSRVVTFFHRQLIRLFATDYIACSRKAGEYLLGKHFFQSPKAHLIRDGLALSKYTYDESVRSAVRASERLGENTYVVAVIGRLAEVKNPLFSLRIFNELPKLRSDAVLWILGDGALRARMEQEVRSYSIDEKVKFWGNREDVSRLMQGIDCVLISSLHEGLCIVGIEAQAAGAPVFCSDTIMDEMAITDLVHGFRLTESPAEIAAQIVKEIGTSERTKQDNRILQSGYAITSCAEELLRIYEK